MTRIVIVVLVLLLLGAIGVSLTLSFFLLSARTALDEPNPLAVQIAESGKVFLVPGDMQAATNPVAANTEVLRAAHNEFRTRCAVCHGEGGKGDGTFGTHMYPRAADLTAARTQSKSDGALFWLVQNGIPHTGMPGWKDVIPDEGIWQLVRYLRQLPNGIPPEVLTAPTPESSRADDPTTTATVSINNQTYVPEEIRISPGTRVVWFNRDDDEHTVTSVGQPTPLDSPAFGKGETYQVTFTETGNFEYFCKIHNWMHGVVVVE